VADIFISYSSEDFERVGPLAAALEASGLSVWWDRNLHGGAVFSQEIETEVDKAALVLVVWTHGAINSQWVADEAELGRRGGKLLPLRLDDIEPPIGFRQIQTIDFLNWEGGLDDAPFQTLLRSCRRLGFSNVPALPSNVSTGAPKASIAVLPFVNMTSDPEQEFFSDGISEELLNLLSKIRPLRVTARTSSFAFKGTDKRIREIGELLGVAHVLEGSVRKAGNRVRITAQLVETKTSFHLWSEPYDRTLDDIFAIQDEISSAIVKALKEHILSEIAPPESNRATDVKAYELYLLGQQLCGKRTRETISNSRSYFEEALAIDPNFVPALVGLANVHLQLSLAQTCYGTTPVDEACKQASPLLGQALALNPNSEEAYTALSKSHELSGEFEPAQAHAERAIELNPNYAPAYRALGLALRQSGDPRAPILRTRQKAISLDPLSLVELSNLSWEFVTRARFEETQELADKIATIDPTSIFHCWVRITLSMAHGKMKDTLATYLQNKEFLNLGWGLQSTLTLFGFGPSREHVQSEEAFYLYCLHGYKADAHRLGTALQNQPAGRSHFLMYALAFWHTQEGRFEEALKLLAPFDETDPGKWGRHFDLDNHCLGARLSYYLRDKLGDRSGADFYTAKLKELYQVRLQDSEGINRITYLLGAYCALIDGNRNEALDSIERFVERAPSFASEAASDPLLSTLEPEPRFQAVMKSVKRHIASERQAAFDSGLLPPSQELLALASD